VLGLDMDVDCLSPVEETALLTVYARALDSRSARSILSDTMADDVARKIRFDFAGLGVSSSVVCLVALRAKMLDDRVRAFIGDHTDGIVVDLGAGLDSALFRVDPPATVDWYSVDLPAVIDLREAVLPARNASHSVAASVAESGWVDAIPADRPTMVVADGLFHFLSESTVGDVFRRITEHFDSGMIAFNDYGAIGRVNRLAKRITARRQMFSTIHSQWAFEGFRDAHYPESWASGLRLAEEATLLREPEVALFPPALRLGSRIGARFPAIASKARILRYQF
jgi:O-methyltransferase involved in polyketide biosynthesis